MNPTEWLHLPEEALMEMKLSSLGLRLEDSPLQPLVDRFYQELKARGLAYLPPCHIGDEWFCPVGIPAIYIPFFLVHPRLRELERKKMLEVEGESPEWFMKLIRHEAGHAYAYAYQLFKRKKWQAQFGKTSSEETPDTYRPRPYSRSFVINLDDWYAQSHPDEDFAETFAVWLNPDLDWRREYQGWKALEKLEYVEELMRSIAPLPPVQTPRYDPSEYAFLNVKLKTYYARKQKLFAETYPDFYDRDLRDLFAAAPGEASLPSAADYLRRHRKELIFSVHAWTNEKKYRIDQLVSKLIRRCRELGLRVKGDDSRQSMQVAAYITTLIMNHLFTGKFKRSK